MKFKVFTLYPQIFNSFLDTSLIARGVSKGILSLELINWRDEFGQGGHNTVDDKPYGGGSGMVLSVEQIHNSLKANNSLSPLYKQEMINTKSQVEPNNIDFYNFKQTNPHHKKVTILLTPRGYPMTQKIAEWLSADFDEISILCGRFEGFDYRTNEMVDLELSLGDFVLNGGEVASMCLIEAVSRLVPGYLTKSSSANHDSFSSSLNSYQENAEFITLTKKDKQKLVEQGLKIGYGQDKGTNIKFNSQNEFEFEDILNINNNPLFDFKLWRSRIDQYEHPQYTRPASYLGRIVPQVLVDGDHKKVHIWRQNWYKLGLK
jgi:tRNA (guanine37-N1)-methyltransferase